MIAAALAALSRSLVHRRRLWAFSIVALAVALAWAAGRLSLRLDEDDFLPIESVESTAREESMPDAIRELPGGRLVAVALESDDEIPTREVERIFTYLEGNLGALPGVRAVRSRLPPGERRFMEEYLPRNILLYVDPSDLRAAGERLTRRGILEALIEASDSTSTTSSVVRLRLRRDPLGLLGVASRAAHRWQGTSRVRPIDGYFGLPDRRAFFLTIESQTALDDIAGARDWVQMVQRVLDQATTDASIGPLLEGKRLYSVGGRVSLVSTFDILYRDVVRVGIAATIVVVILLGLFFRRFVAALVLLTAVGIGLVATAAMAALAFGTVSLMAWVFIGLMIGLGVDFGIHLASHYWVLADAGAGRREALGRAIAKPGPAIILGGLTSAAAFLAILAIPYPVTREVAWLTSIGLLATLASSLTVLPLLLSFSAPSSHGRDTWARLLAPFGRWGRRSPTVGVVPWVLLVGAALLLAPSIPFESHPWMIAVRGNPGFARLDRLSREMGSAFTPLRMVSTGSTAEEAIDRDRAAVRSLQRVALRAGVANIESLSRWLPAPEDQSETLRLVRSEPDLFSPERFERDFRDAVARLDDPSPYLTDKYLPLIVAALNPDLEAVTLGDLERLGLADEIARHLARREGVYAVSSYVYLRQYPWAEGAVPRFLDVSEAAGILDLPGLTLAGKAMSSATHASIIRRSLALATFLAVVLVVGILWLRFRRVAFVALCLAPLVCGLSAAIILMRLLGLELTLLTITIGPVLVGIGVDDGIHMVERLSRGESLDTVLREAGSCMTMTTLTTVGALACLALATFAGVRELGLVGGVGLLTCLLASVHLIPVGWRLCFRACPGES